MTASTGTNVRTAAARRAGRLRFPTLFVLIALLFVADLLVPDFIPFVDEIILGLATAVLATLREKRREPPPEQATRVG